MLDYLDIDQPNVLILDEKNMILATNNFLDAMTSVLNKYVPRKKVNKYKLKFKTKPWVTSSILNQSILKQTIKLIHQ